MIKNKAKSIIVLLISLNIVACNSGSATSVPTTVSGEFCTVNINNTAGYLEKSYINQSPLLALTPDALLSNMGGLTPNTVNGVIAGSGAFNINNQAGQGVLLYYSVANYSSGVYESSASITVTSSSSLSNLLDGGHCLTIPLYGAYNQDIIYGPPYEITTGASITGCFSQVPTIGQTYTFTGNYSINASSAFPAESGSFQYTCTPTMTSAST